MDGYALTPNTSIAASFGRANPIENGIVTGWFVAPAGDERAALLTAFIDGQPSGRAALDTNAAKTTAPEQARAFSYAIPPRHLDGRSHVLSLILSSGAAIEFPTTRGLTRSNLRFRLEAPNQRDRRPYGPANPATSNPPAVTTYAGLADPFSDTTITGWGVAPRTPNVPVEISMFIDGHPAGTERCTHRHEHLTKTRFPAETGGFAYSIPDKFLDGASHTHSILFEDGSTLFFRGENESLQAKIEFTAEPVTSVVGVVDGLHGDLIKGWAPRRHHRTGDFEGHLRLQVLCNGFVIEEILADHPRVDVACQHRCDPRGRLRL